MKTKTIGHFTIQQSNDAIAIDNRNGLMWLRFSCGQEWDNGTKFSQTTQVNWEDALRLVKNFNQQGGYADYQDWRLPTIDELGTLIDKNKGKKGNYIDTEVFPKNNDAFCWFWTSSPYTNSDCMRVVLFYDGVVGYNYKTCRHGAVRLVRSNS
jgi:hypothetical protein